MFFSIIPKETAPIIKITRKILLAIRFDDPLLPTVKRKFEFEQKFVNGELVSPNVSVVPSLANLYRKEIGLYWEHAEYADQAVYHGISNVPHPQILYGEALKRKGVLVRRRRKALTEFEDMIGKEILHLLRIKANRIQKYEEEVHKARTAITQEVKLFGHAPVPLLEM